MHIGEKIKALRMAKMMTQAELAGDQITRNMLSRIEHGAAFPSLQTVTYLAARLNVPAGFLLAEEGDDFLYRKMNSIGNIRHAFSRGDYRSCRDICESLFGEGRSDDEIALILAGCTKEIGMEELHAGRLHTAVRDFDAALRYAAATVYDTALIRAEIAVCLAWLREFSPMLSSDMLDNPDGVGSRAYASGNAFCRYIAALSDLAEGNEGLLARYLAQEDERVLYPLHVRARRCMAQSDYAGALVFMRRIMDAQEVPPQILLYSTICDMEICCRETDDYRGAYEYARDKIGLRERLLEDVQ